MGKQNNCSGTHAGLKNIVQNGQKKDTKDIT
jgi:L-asparaginase II